MNELEPIKEEVIVNCSECINRRNKHVCYVCADYSEKNKQEGKKSFYADKNSEASFILPSGQFFALSKDDFGHIIMTLKNTKSISSREVTTIQMSENQANILQIHLYRLMKRHRDL